MVFLQPSTTESAFVFSTEDGSDAIVLDMKGVYALIDGGSEPLNFLQSLRTPTAAIVSSASPSSLTNAIQLNRGSDALVAVVGNLPSAASIKDAAAAEPIRELCKTLSVPPFVAQLKGAKPEPFVVHKNLSSGTLSVYTLAGDAKDAEAVAKAYQSGSAESIEAAAAAASSVLLIVWEPARADAAIKRILHLGSAPLPRIQQALDRARALPFLQSATASAASLKTKPAPSAGGAARPPPASARPSARVAPAAHAAPAAAKPAARVAPATRAAPPAGRPAAAARPAPAPAATKGAPSTRASMPARPAAPPTTGAASSARPARTSTAPTRAAPPAGGRGAAKEEVARRTIVGKSSAAPSSARSATGTPNGGVSKVPAKAAAPPKASPAPVAAAAAVAVAAVAGVTAVAALDGGSVSPPPSSPLVSPPATLAAAPSITIDHEAEGVSTPGGLPVPASPTIIPATPQPPMSPEPEETHQEPVRPETPEPTPVVPPVEEKPEDVHDEEEKQPSAPPAEEEKEDAVPAVPSAPLEPTPSVDEPECVKEVVEEEPEPVVPTPTPTPEEPSPPHEEEKEEPAVVPTPTDPTPVGDLLGDFNGEPVQPQQPGDDGLLDSLEEPMKKMQISMDTDKLAEELGLGGGEKREGGVEGEESLLDFSHNSTHDGDQTLNTAMIETANEFDDLLSPTKESAEEMQRKLSTQAEENLLAAAAAPFIAGLVSSVVETATIDGAKSTLDSLMNNSGVESPTGDKLLSFRSSGFENPDEPKEVKYEETDPAIDDVLTKLADESDMVNGGRDHVELNGHGDGHHIVNGNGWPEGTTMHLPPPAPKGSAKETKFKLAGPVHVDLVTVPHRGKQILLNDEAASIEFFSSVRSSIYILQTGGEVPIHVLEGWKRGKGQWAANVASRLVPTHHNDVVSRWASDHVDELAEVGLTVAVPVDSTTLTYPDGQAKACTIVL